MTIVLGRPPKTEDELYHLTQALWGHTYAMSYGTSAYTADRTNLDEVGGRYQ